MSLGFEFQTNINVYKPHDDLLKILDASFTTSRYFWNSSFASELEGFCKAAQAKKQLLWHKKGQVLIDAPAGWKLTADAADCEFITDPIPVDASFDKAD